MKNLLSYAERYKTPLFVYDGDKIIDQYHYFLNAFNVKNIKIHFAAKSLSNINNILKLFQKIGAGLDCLSIEEVEIGLKAKFKSQDIMNNQTEVDIKINHRNNSGL